MKLATLAIFKGNFQITVRMSSKMQCSIFFGIVMLLVVTLQNNIFLNIGLLLLGISHTNNSILKRFFRPRINASLVVLTGLKLPPFFSMTSEKCASIAPPVTYQAYLPYKDNCCEFYCLKPREGIRLHPRSSSLTCHLSTTFSDCLEKRGRYPSIAQRYSRQQCVFYPEKLSHSLKLYLCSTILFLTVLKISHLNF